MPVSVIIPNLDSPVIGETLAALRAQTALDQVCEILVVGRDRPGLVREDVLVRHLDPGRPLSPAAARNVGVRESRGDLLLFIDADCVPEPELLARLLAALRLEHGALGAGVVPLADNYWRLASDMEAFPSALATDIPGERPCLPSFCMLVPRAVLDEVGLFDETLPLGSCEDLDITFRMRRAGYTLWCEPRAALRHRHGRTTIGDVWRRHASFGPAWYHICRTYTDFIPRSEAKWVCEHFGGFALAILVPLTILFELRLVLQQPHMLRHWYALPGMIWARLALYNGVWQAIRWSIRPRDVVRSR
jgi:GT2 family glycosyltransferase